MKKNQYLFSLLPLIVFFIFAISSFPGNADAINFDLQTDTVAPSVVFVSPASGATVSSTITVSASSTDNAAVSSVEFRIDGGTIGTVTSTATSTPTIYSFSWNTAATTNATHTLLAFATDSSNNTSSVSITITVANTGPLVLTSSPSGVLAYTTTSTTISLTTDSSSTCRYSNTAGVAYASIPNTFTTTGATTHSQAISGLTPGSSYVYYVRCQSSQGIANTADTQIAFSVAASSDTPSVGVPPAPTVSGGGWGGGGSSWTPDAGSATSSVSTSPTIAALQQTIAMLKEKLRILLEQAAARGLPIASSASKTCIPVSPNPNALVRLTTPFTRVLFYGSKGPDVVRIQRFLIENNAGPRARALRATGATGLFIGLTQNALSEFQKTVCIDSTGVLGAATMTYLNSLGGR